jgi:hypothetical protein
MNTNEKAISVVSSKAPLPAFNRQLPISQCGFTPSPAKILPSLANINVQNINNNNSLFTYNNSLVSQTEAAIKNFLLSQGQPERMVAHSLSLIGALAGVGTTNFQKSYHSKAIDKPEEPQM